MAQKVIRTEYSDGKVVLSNIRNNKGFPIFRENDTVTATKVTQWYDGSVMSLDKADGKVYLRYKATGEYFMVNLPNFGELFLEKDSMQAMRDMSSTEILLLKMGYWKGVRLNGYYTKNDTPAPIEYYLSETSDLDDGGSVIVVGDIKLERDFKGVVNPLYFGVKESNSVLSLQNMASYLNKNEVSVLDFKGLSKLELEQSLSFTQLRDLNILGYGITISRKLGSGGVVLLDIDSNSYNIDINSVKIDGLRNDSESFYSKVSQIHVTNNARTTNNSMGIRVNNYSKANIENCKFNNIHGWGVYSVTGSLLNVNNCGFNNIARIGIESNRTVLKTVVSNSDFSNIGILPDSFLVDGVVTGFDELVSGSKYFTDNGDGVMFLGQEGHCYNCRFENINRLPVVYDVPATGVKGRVFLHNNTIFKNSNKTRCSNPSGIFWIEYGNEAYVYNNKAFMYQTSPEDLVCQGFVFAQTDRVNCNAVFENNEVYNISYNRSLVGINFTSFEGDLKIHNNKFQGSFYGCLVHNAESGKFINNLDIQNNELNNTNSATNSSSFIVESTIGYLNLIYKGNVVNQTNKTIPALQTRNLGKSLVVGNYFNGANVTSGFTAQLDLIFQNNQGVGVYEFNKNSGSELSKISIVNNDIDVLKMYNASGNTAGSFAYTGDISLNRLKSGLQISSGKSLRVIGNEINGGIGLFSSLHENNGVVISDNDLSLSAINQTGIYVNNTIAVTDIFARNNNINGKGFSGTTGIFYQVAGNRTSSVNKGNDIRKVTTVSLNCVNGIGANSDKPTLETRSLSSSTYFDTDSNQLLVWDGFNYRTASPNATATIKGLVNQSTYSADTATVASGANPTKAEFDALLAEFRDFKTKSRTSGQSATS